MLLENIKTGTFLEFVYDFYKKMKENEISLVYEGEITHQITKAFTAMAEKNLESQKIDSSVQKKVFHVMVECLQNISKHTDKINEEQEPRGIFIVSRNKDSYFITTGNILTNEKSENLKKSLELVNSLDKEGLKDAYKKQIMGGELSSKGGAGLGLIDIAKKTGNKFDYHFLPIDDNFSFFILISKVSL